MRDASCRAIAAALLGLMVVAAGSGVAKAVARMEHACCARAATDDASPAPEPCHGFLPLSCCQAAALPSSEAPPAPPLLALPMQAALAPIAPPRIATDLYAAPAPRASPPRLSVVLQL